MEIHKNSQAPEKLQILIDSQGTTTYVGEAKTGALVSAASWRIQKISKSGSITTIVWADGDTNFDNIWANRASLTYS